MKKKYLIIGFIIFSIGIFTFEYAFANNIVDRVEVEWHPNGVYISANYFKSHLGALGSYFTIYDTVRGSIVLDITTPKPLDTFFWNYNGEKVVFQFPDMFEIYSFTNSEFSKLYTFIGHFIDWHPSADKILYFEYTNSDSNYFSWDLSSDPVQLSNPPLGWLGDGIILNEGYYNVSLLLNNEKSDPFHGKTLFISNDKTRIINVTKDSWDIFDTNLVPLSSVPRRGDLKEFNNKYFYIQQGGESWASDADFGILDMSGNQVLTYKGTYGHLHPTAPQITYWDRNSKSLEIIDEIHHVSVSFPRFSKYVLKFIFAEIFFVFITIVLTNLFYLYSIQLEPELTSKERVIQILYSAAFFHTIAGFLLLVVSLIDSGGAAYYGFLLALSILGYSLPIFLAIEVRNRKNNRGFRDREKKAIVVNFLVSHIIFITYFFYASIILGWIGFL